MKYSLLLTAITLFATVTLHAEATPGPIRDLYPLTSFHLSNAPRSAHPMPEGVTTLESSFLWANTSAIRDQYTVDAETRDLRFTLKHGLTTSSTLAIELPLIYRGGGVLDPFIESWHDFWSLPNGRRGTVEESSYDISGTTTNGEEFAWTDSGTGLGNIVARYRQGLFHSSSSRSSIAFESVTSLPTATSSLGHNGVDTSLGVLASSARGKWDFHSGVSALYVGDIETSKVRYERWRAEGFASIVYSFSSLSLFSTFVYTSKIVSNIANHPNYSSFLDFGGTISLSEATDLTLAIREEMVTGNGSQDVGFFVSLGYGIS